MSTALAIAGVTAVLRDRLNDTVVNHNVAGVVGSSVTVSVLPPDRVVPADGTESSQLNLFLYNVTPNPGWRNEGLPSHDSSGRNRLSNPPLALDLHYLISAYGDGYLHAEILLGYAAQLMHEYPIITRAMIRTALNPSPDVGDSLPQALRSLADCGLADQVESLRITPQNLNTEELSKLWTSTQASFRPTVAFQVSVVLIEATKPTRPSLPVLTRSVAANPDLVPPLPTLETIVPAGKQPVVRLDETTTLTGHHLEGADRQVHLRNERFHVDEMLAATGANVDDHLEFVIPGARAADFPVGIYDVTARLAPPGEPAPRETNRLACVVAPNITNLPQSVARDGGGDAHITIIFTPQLRAGQSVSLLLGQEEIAPETFAAPTGSLNFIAKNAEAGAPLARLRIDGVDSPIVDHTVDPPVFFDQRVTIT